MDFDILSGMSRLAAFQSLLNSNRIPVFLVSSPQNIFYLTGFRGLAPFEREVLVLVMKEKTYLITSKSYEGEAQTSSNIEVVIPKTGENFYQSIVEILKDQNQNSVHFETRDLRHVEFRYLQSLCPTLTLTPHNGLVEDLRVVKDENEIEKITKASEISSQVLSVIARTFGTKQSDTSDSVLTTNYQLLTTEQSLAWLIEKTARDLGAEGVVFPPIVASGAHSARSHHRSNTTKLGSEPVMVDFGVQFDGYITDVTRMFFPKVRPFKGRTFSEFADTYERLLEVHQSIIHFIQIGQTGREVFEYAAGLLKKEKLDESYTGILGHGVGLQIHENPRLSSTSTTMLQENMVFTVEPGVYISGKFGMRIEDTVLLTKSGCKALTTYTKELSQ